MAEVATAAAECGQGGWRAGRSLRTDATGCGYVQTLVYVGASVTCSTSFVTLAHMEAGSLPLPSVSARA
eukprot:3228516-Pleurochrysis_carterae.AAC.1